MNEEELFLIILEAMRKECGCPLDESHAQLAVNAIKEKYEASQK